MKSFYRWKFFSMMWAYIQCYINALLILQFEVMPCSWITFFIASFMDSNACFRVHLPSSILIQQTQLWVFGPVFCIEEGGLIHDNTGLLAQFTGTWWQNAGQSCSVFSHKLTTHSHFSFSFFLFSFHVSTMFFHTLSLVHSVADS